MYFLILSFLCFSLLPNITSCESDKFSHRKYSPADFLKTNIINVVSCLSLTISAGSPSKDIFQVANTTKYFQQRPGQPTLFVTTKSTRNFLLLAKLLKLHRYNAAGDILPRKSPCIHLVQTQTSQWMSRHCTVQCRAI